MTSWSIEPIPLHRVSVPGPEVFFQREFFDSVDLVIYAFLLRSSSSVVLVDTGLYADYADLNRSIRARKGERSGFVDLGARLPDRLKAVGCRPDAILLTSFGPYAVGGVAELPDVPILASARGCADLEQPEEPALVHRIPANLQEILLSARTTRVGGEREVGVGLRFLEVGIHHPASAALLVNTGRGVVGISDPVFVARNLTHGLALGAAETAGEWHRHVRRLGHRVDAILPIHDPVPSPVARESWHALLRQPQPL